jgi:hypothetical protein
LNFNLSLLRTKIIEAATCQASHQDSGKCNIDDELYSDQNEHFVLHDSQGYEPGETTNLDRVKKFLESRSKEPDIKNRLHAVW